MQTVLVKAEPREECTIKCPLCAETIQKEAIKCRFCGEFLDKSQQKKIKWYYSNGTVVMGLLTLGPLALPLVWFNPRYNIILKGAITIIIIALTVVLWQATVNFYNNFMEQVRALGLN